MHPITTDSPASTHPVTLAIDGMSCGHCVAGITAAVGALPDVTGVTVDLAGGAVEVSGYADRHAVMAAIEDCGYHVRSAA